MNKDLVLEKSISMIDSVETMTSLDLVGQINIFRNNENRSNLAHGDLLKIIRNEFEEEINDGKISCVDYLDSKGEKRPMFKLTLSQAKQLLVRESKFVRKAVIAYIEKLEAAIEQSSRPSYMIDDPIKRAEKWIEEQKEKQALALESEKAKKHIELLVHDAKTYTTSELAKELNLKSAVALNNILHENGIQYKQNGTWLLYSNYSDKEYTSIKQTTLDSGKIVFDRRWTSLGRDFILNLLNNK